MTFYNTSLIGTIGTSDVLKVLHEPSWSCDFLYNYQIYKGSAKLLFSTKNIHNINNQDGI